MESATECIIVYDIYLLYEYIFIQSVFNLCAENELIICEKMLQSKGEAFQYTV